MQRNQCKNQFICVRQISFWKTFSHDCFSRNIYIYLKIFIVFCILSKTKQRQGIFICKLCSGIKVYNSWVFNLENNVNEYRMGNSLNSQEMSRVIIFPFDFNTPSPPTHTHYSKTKNNQMIESRYIQKDCKTIKTTTLQRLSIQNLNSYGASLHVQLYTEKDRI